MLTFGHKRMSTFRIAEQQISVTSCQLLEWQLEYDNLVVRTYRFAC